MSTATTKNLGTIIRAAIADHVGGTVVDSHEMNDDNNATANYSVDLGHVGGITPLGNRLTLEVRTWTRDGKVAGEIRSRILTEDYEFPKYREGRKWNGEISEDVRALEPFENVPNVSLYDGTLSLSTGRIDREVAAFHRAIVDLGLAILDITID